MTTGHKAGDRGLRKPRAEDAEKRARRLANLQMGDNAAAKATRARKAAEAAGPDILTRIQGMDIIEFAHVAGFSFEGRPGQELVLRLLHGMPLPEGRIKVYVRRPCEGFILEQREVSWLEYYNLLTGNSRLFEPYSEKTELFACVGARGGKSTITGIETLYQATRLKWRDYLRPKEMGYAGIIATNLDQARDLIQQTCDDILTETDLKPLIADSGKRQIILTSGLGIRSFPCNVRAPRGFPFFFTAYDEAGWYYLEGPRADTQVHSAINPRRLQFPGSKHVEITTPAGKQGRFYTEHSMGGQVHRRLTIQAPTWLFRPEIVEADPDFLAGEFRSNPEEADREYGASWDEVVDQLLPTKETEEAMTLPGDAPYDPNICYGMGIDASGLTGNDRFGLAIAGRDPHRNHRHVTAIVRSYTEKQPEPIMADLSELAKRYRIRQVYTDRYAKGWVWAAIRKEGLEPVLVPRDIEVWLNLKQLILGHCIDMPMDNELKEGLLTTRKAHGSADGDSTSQAERIVRPRNRRGHGDKAQALANSIWASSQNIWSRGGSTQTAEEKEAAARRKREQENYDPLTHWRTRT